MYAVTSSRRNTYYKVLFKSSLIYKALHGNSILYTFLRGIVVCYAGLVAFDLVVVLW